MSSTAANTLSCRKGDFDISEALTAAIPRIPIDGYLFLKDFDPLFT
jgi:hypothetical protein